MFVAFWDHVKLITVAQANYVIFPNILTGISCIWKEQNSHRIVSGQLTYLCMILNDSYKMPTYIQPNKMSHKKMVDGM